MVWMVIGMVWYGREYRLQMVICMERMVWLDCMVRKDGHMVMDVRYARDQDGDGSGPPSDILATAPRSSMSSSASFNY